jgi:putative ubiquitin-RnfH superfamily antitoxin RatB of RatAB toxin-antitoxin module
MVAEMRKAEIACLSKGIEERTSLAFTERCELIGKLIVDPNSQRYSEMKIFRE